MKLKFKNKVSKKNISVAASVTQKSSGLENVIQRSTIADMAVDGLERPWNQNCMMAVLKWLNQAVNLCGDEEYLEKINADPINVIRKMAEKGVQLNWKSDSDKRLRLNSNRIIIFTRADEMFPVHAAVSISDSQMAGYNQTHWFNGPMNDYSVSDLENIHWKSMFAIENSLGNENNIYEVDSGQAISVFEERESGCPCVLL